MNGFRTFAQRQRCNTVILRDNDVPPLAEVDQRDIHRVRPGTDNTDSSSGDVIFSRLMSDLSHDIMI